MKDIYKEFEKYIDNYDRNNEKIILKYNHSLSVVNIAKKIALSLNFNKEDLDLVEKCSLLHDIARFKQAKEYDTFEDSLSFDHGDIGVEILKNDSYISKYEEDLEKQEIILKTVKNHNKFKIEENLDEKINLFCKIIRDADKVDILLNQGVYKIFSDYNISDDIYNSFKENKMVNNKYVLNSADNMLRQIAFIFDLEFKESFKILDESNVINKIISYIKNNSNTKYIDDIEDIVDNYINNQLN